MFIENSPQQILDYLQERLPHYPFHPDLDPDFVQELTGDFEDVDILEEIKTFRWYYDNAPVQRFKNIRVALRRWLARAHNRPP